LGVTGEDMSNNIIKFPSKEDLDKDFEINPSEMLSGIVEDVPMKEALVVGWTEEEKLFIGTSHGKTADMLFLMELAKSVLMSRCVGEE
jgi:hypothetical protein